MTAASRPMRARRGRTLIVGEIPELAALLARHRLTSGAAIVARNLFDALGEITTASAATPIATIVLSDTDLSNWEQAIQALRRVDPALRIVVVASRDSMDAEADGTLRSHGVDEVMHAPLSPGDLQQLFDEDLLSPGTPVIDLPESVEAPEPKIPEQRRQSIRRDRKTMPVHPPTPTSLGGAAPVMHAPTPPPPPSQSPPPAVVSRQQPASVASHDSLGDVDLVEAVMHSPDRVVELALQLIKQHTKWLDVAFSATSQVESDANSPLFVAVIHDNARFGTLSASHATAQQLQPWAEWLAHWLALNQKHQEHRHCSQHDDLTGAGNRRFFDLFLREAIQLASISRRPVTVMVFDIDNFKSYNDQFGHEAGDDILRETVRLMQSVIRKGDRVCRIGGDEFAVIFADDEGPREPGSRHPESIETIASRFRDQICKMKFPKLGADAPGTLSISAGLATFPWDGADAMSLLRRADQLAMESKRKGKNLITFGPGAQEACGPQT